MKGRAKDDLLTNFIARRQVLVLMARKPFLPVQQQEVDHLLLVLAGRRHGGRGREKLCEVSYSERSKKLSVYFPHSWDTRSLVNLSLSRKQPSEFMLSRTSGSMSSAKANVRIATFLGTGCSGSGSFLPALMCGHTQTPVPRAASGNRRVLKCVQEDRADSTYRYQLCFWICSSWKTEGRRL